MTTDSSANAISKAVDNMIIWEIVKSVHEDWYEFSIPWTDKQRKADWINVCIWIVEQFGLPGERYVMHPDKEEMTVLFRNAKDYEWMLLKWG